MKFTTLLTVLLLAAPAGACIWDYDTLRDEQRGLPSVAAVLAGKWERHSDFFYERRVERMRRHLEGNSGDLDAVDNLAVALEKLGRGDEAIALLTPIVEANPRWYTALANLGTFHLHAGDLDAGIAFIRRAIEVNPDAHFGREKYQLMLAEHARDGRPSSFVASMLTRRPVTRPADLALTRGFRLNGRKSHDEAITGVVGMIRFGTGTSPRLYDALGDLLAARGDKHLAAFAYLRALEHDHPRPAEVREALDAVIGPIGGEPTVEELQVELDRLSAEGRAWTAAYQEYEDDLVRRGVDSQEPSAYAAFYMRHGDPRAPGVPDEPGILAKVLIALAFVIVPPVAAMLFFARRQRRVAFARRGAFA